MVKQKEEEMDYEENNSSNSNDYGDISYELKIPEERVAVLIGANGETKKEIEQETKCHLDISKEGDVVITGEDGLLLFTAKEIIRAIARGFNPKLAMLLLKQDHILEMIDMKDIAGKSKNTMERLKGRVIGSGGKSRAEIERLTDTHISIYGKTIGILGEMGAVSLARQAVAMLLQGSMHKTVYQFLEKKKKEILFG
ncbi:MAG: KH domain-containing protein [Nanoarchaeota archaeon]